MFKKLIGDKPFYKQLIWLVLPIMVQNGITNFVNMLDNIMVGATDSAQMTGVAVSNQLIFVFNLCIFGAVSGAGIFGAQFFGKKDVEGVHHTFRFKIIFCALLTLLGIGIFVFGGEDLISLYMKGDSGIIDPTKTLNHAKEYLSIMLIGLLPHAIVQCYSSTLRESGNPALPMKAGLVAVAVNLCLNWVLIFGKFGFPALGSTGAAIATVISRFAELLVVALGTHLNLKKYYFMKGVFKSLYIPKTLMKGLFIKGLPLMLNETLWSMGVATLNQCYSVYSIDVVAACNISQTFWNVFSVAFISIGAAIGIIIGQHLGANRLSEAKRDAYRLMFVSFAVSAVMGILYAVLAEFIPLAYNTEKEIQSLATTIMQITAIAMPFDALAHSAYFTLRSGGKMLITFIFDCGFMWLLNVLPAMLVVEFTAIPFVALFAIIHGVTALKAVGGIFLVKSGFWVKNIVPDN